MRRAALGLAARLGAAFDALLAPAAAGEPPGAPDPHIEVHGDAANDPLAVELLFELHGQR